MNNNGKSSVLINSFQYINILLFQPSSKFAGGQHAPQPGTSVDAGWYVEKNSGVALVL